MRRRGRGSVVARKVNFWLLTRLRRLSRVAIRIWGLSHEADQRTRARESRQLTLNSEERAREGERTH